MKNLLADRLEAHRRNRPESIALADARQQVRHGELIDLIDDRRRMLQAHEARVVAIGLDNCVDWVLWDLAIAFSDCICVPIPPFFSTGQREHALRSAGVDTLISHRGLVRCTHPRLDLPTGAGKITFTSGTTGSPKGIYLRFADLIQVAVSIQDRVGPDPQWLHLPAMPLGVLLENVAGVYSALLTGCRIDLEPLADTWMNPPSLLKTLCSTRANTVIVVPGMLKGLIEAMGQSGQRLPHLKFVAVGGARVSTHLIEQARLLGLPVYEGYGLTECGSVVSLNTPARDFPGTAGGILPNVELHIENGEIVITNPPGLRLPDCSRQDRLHTGDLGNIDAHGVLRVNGRRSNVLITSWGRNISPEWPESELLGRPGIQQAVICGDGWARPGALIVADPMLTHADLQAQVDAANTNLPEYARVAAWLRVEPFTTRNGLLTGNGRPRRNRIIETYLSQLEDSMHTREFHEELFEATRDARRHLYNVPVLVDGLNGRIDRPTYIAYLTEAYHHVRHTVPLLMSMGALLPTEKQWLLDSIIEYIDEEKGHEQWILADIGAAGGDPERARTSTPAYATRLMIAYNHDYIRRINPVGFLGMIFMLESTSVEIATRGATSIQATLGLPDAAFSYLYSHGKLDQDHMAFFRTLVNRIHQRSDREAIIEVARTTFQLFADLFAGLSRETETRHVA